MNVDSKYFSVEAGTLQSLQQLIQWVVDLCLWVVASVAQGGCQPIHKSGHHANRGPAVSYAFEFAPYFYLTYQMIELKTSILYW
jgi:hypothetical protein